MGGKDALSLKIVRPGDFAGKAVATRDAYGAALLSLGARDDRIVVLDADLSCSTKTIQFGRTFPARFFNMGISEQDMVGTAAGLSLTGKIPFASTFAVFETGRAWEQVRQTVCYSKLNVKLAATHSGVTVGEDGASHQAVEDIALMRVLPGMTVVVPADGYETAQVIEAAAAYKGPVYIRLGRSKVRPVMPQDYSFRIGKAHTFALGKDAVIVAAGIMVSAALEARDLLLKDRIDAGVINMSTIKPLDGPALLDAARNTRCIVTAEEHSILGGLGGAVAEYLSEHHPIPVKRIGVRDTFGCSGSPSELLTFYGLTADEIALAVRETLQGIRPST